MIPWLLLLGCAPDPHVKREPVPVPVHALLDGTAWDCDWVAVVGSRVLTVEHRWTFEADKVTTDLADQLRDAIVRKEIQVWQAELTAYHFLDFRGYGWPVPRYDLDFSGVPWHGVGADTLLIGFDRHEPAEKWTVVPSGVDAMHLDRDGEDPWVISCRPAE